MTHRALRSPNGGSTIVNVFKTNEGGTGSTTITGAIELLNGITTDKIGTTLVKLETGNVIANSLLPASVFGEPTIDGDTEVYTSSNVNYTITNYDSQSVYSIQALSGNVTRNGSTITYTTPSISGPAGFKVNDKTYNITVISSIVGKPVITTPTNNSTNVSTHLTVTSTDFNPIGSEDTHASSTWELSTNIAFTNIIKSSTSDTVNKTSWEISELSLNTTYYVRVKHSGSTLGDSAWSDTISFITRDTDQPIYEVGYVCGVDTENFVSYTSLDTDGTRMAVAGKFGSSSVNSIRIYKRTNQIWNLETTLSSSFNITYLKLSTNGDKLLISSNSLTGGSTLYTRNDTSWSITKTVTFGNIKSSSDVLNRVISGNTLYRWDTDNYVSEYTFIRNAGNCISGDGLVIATIAESSPTNVIKVYKRVSNETTWTEQEVVVNATAPLTFVSDFVSINYDGSLIVTYSNYIKENNSIYYTYLSNFSSNNEDVLLFNNTGKLMVRSGVSNTYKILYLWDTTENGYGDIHSVYKNSGIDSYLTSVALSKNGRWMVMNNRIYTV